MTKIKLYVGQAALDNAIKGIHTTGQKLQAELHKVALSVLAHVSQHGDIRPIAKLLQAVPQAVRANALRAWFEEFGPVGFESGKPYHKKGATARLDEAEALPFWDFKPEPEYVPVNVQKALETLIAKLVRDEAKTGIDHGPVIASLKGQMQTLQAGMVH